MCDVMRYTWRHVVGCIIRAGSTASATRLVVTDRECSTDCQPVIVRLYRRTQ